MSRCLRPFSALSLPTAFRLFLAAVSGLASAAAFFATRRSLATADALGQHALESTAFALSASVEGALRERKGVSELRGILLVEG